MTETKKYLPDLVICLLLIISFLLISGSFPFYFDDAFISFQITANIKSGIGPYLFKGNKVYSSTSLLYPFFNLMPAAVHGKNWIEFIPYWNGTFIALAFFICLKKSDQHSFGNTIHTIIIILMLLSWLFGQRSLIYGNSGLETGLYLLLLAACLHLPSLRLLSPWLIFIRPDGWLAGWAILIDSILRKDKSGLVKISLSIAVSFLLWMLAGYLLFDTVIPQSISAKSNHIIDRFNEIQKGLSYAMFAGHIIPFALFLFACIRHADFRKAVQIPVFWAILYLAFFSFAAAWWPWYLPPLYAAFWFLSMKAGFRLLSEYRISGFKAGLLLVILSGSSYWQLKNEFWIIKESSEACSIRMDASRKLAAFLTDSIPGQPTIMLEPLGMLSWYAPELEILDFPGLATPSMASFLKSLPWSIPHRLTDTRTDSAILNRFKPKAIVLWPEELRAFRNTAVFKNQYQLRKRLAYFPKEKRMDSVSVFVRIRN